MESIIQIKNVSKQFKSHTEPVEVFSDVSLDIFEGEILCLLGPSGCGKSTLLRTIGGFEKINSGEILSEGQPITGPSSDRILVFQAFDQLLPWKTVLQNIVFGLKEVKKLGKKEAESIAMALMKLVNLTGTENLYPYQLSGGMKQRVAIARALALNPKVLLMDEPFVSLDSQISDTLRRELFRIWKETNVTIVFVTHNIGEAIFLGQRIVMLSTKPNGIKFILENKHEHPFTPEQEGFSKLYDKCYHAISNDQNETIKDG